jgi:hypothetical protein
MQEKLALDYKSHMTNLIFREKDAIKIKANDFINVFTDLILDLGKKMDKELMKTSEVKM